MVYSYSSRGVKRLSVEIDKSQKLNILNINKYLPFPDKKNQIAMKIYTSISICSLSSQKYCLDLQSNKSNFSIKKKSNFSKTNMNNNFFQIQGYNPHDQVICNKPVV